MKFLVNSSGIISEIKIYDIWSDLSGTYSTISTFTFTGTAANAKQVEGSLFTCTDSAGTTRRIGYVKSASESGGTVTTTVVTNSNLASGDKDFKVTLDIKKEKYKWEWQTGLVEVVEDATNPQGAYFYAKSAVYLLPEDSVLAVAAAGNAPNGDVSWNTYDDGTALYSAAASMAENQTLVEQRPTTIAIAAGSFVTHRVTNVDGNTQMPKHLKIISYIVPQTIFTAF